MDPKFLDVQVPKFWIFRLPKIWISRLPKNPHGGRGAGGGRTNALISLQPALHDLLWQLKVIVVRQIRRFEPEPPNLFFSEPPFFWGSGGV